MSSGSRLKGTKLVASDGFSATYYLIRDTLRNEDCSISLAADDKQRCLPLVGYANFVTWFTDSGCTQQLAYVTPCASAPKYGAKTEAAPTCGQSHWRIYQLGVKLAPATPLWQGSPANCTTLNPASVAMYDLYPVGSEVPASSFMEAAVVMVP